MEQIVKNNSNGVVVQVWDPLIRIGHWLIVCGFFIAYIVEDDKLKVHVWAGYTVGIVLLIRLLWGFMGPENARFSSFIYKPQRILRYLADLPRGQARRYLDHSPAGGAMIIALILGLLIITVSGLMVYAYEEHSGPVSIFITPMVEIDSAAPGGHAGHSMAAAEFEEREEFWEELHELAANFTLALVLLHILGVALASWIHRENLVASMITGKKYCKTREPGAS